MKGILFILICTVLISCSRQNENYKKVKQIRNEISVEELLMLKDWEYEPYEWNLDSNSGFVLRNSYLSKIQPKISDYKAYVLLVDKEKNVFDFLFEPDTSVNVYMDYYKQNKEEFIDNFIKSTTNFLEYKVLGFKYDKVENTYKFFLNENSVLELRNSTFQDKLDTILTGDWYLNNLLIE